MKELLKRLLSSEPVLRALEVIDRRTENRMTEFGMIAQAFEFKKINKVNGDYFEFGLWRGKTFLYAHTMKKRYGLKNVTLRGFDSFEGLPAHQNTPDNIWHPGQFACSEEELRKIFKSKGVGEEEFDLVKGFYDQSLNEDLDRRLKGVKAAIIYIDCDLYESTRTVLQWVKRYLVNGTIICFDDYYNNRGATDQGEAQALQEFIEANPAIHLIPYFIYSPLGKSFIVRLD